MPGDASSDMEVRLHVLDALPPGLQANGVHGSGILRQGTADSLTAPDDGSVRLAWKSLTVKSTKGKVLLKGVTGKIKNGFYAIMGPSGSGELPPLEDATCLLRESSARALILARPRELLHDARARRSPPKRP